MGVGRWGAPAGGGWGGLQHPYCKPWAGGGPSLRPREGQDGGEMGAEKRVVLQEEGLSNEKQNGVAGGVSSTSPGLKIN